MLSLKAPKVIQGWFSLSNSRASPGSGKSVCQPIYRNLLMLGCYPGNPILVAQQLFLRNNSLYSELYGHPSAASKVKSNTLQHSKAHTPLTPTSTLWFQLPVGHNPMHTRKPTWLMEIVLTTGGPYPSCPVMQKWHVPWLLHGTPYTCTHPTGQPQPYGATGHTEWSWSEKRHAK